MEVVLNIVLTLLFSLVAVVVCFLLAVLAVVLYYGDKGREDPSLPPRSRWQLFRIFIFEAIPRMFAVLVLRKPLTEEEERYARLRATPRTDAPTPDALTPDALTSDAAGPLPEPATLPADPPRARGGRSRYEQWLRQRRRRGDKTE